MSIRSRGTPPAADLVEYLQHSNRIRAIRWHDKSLLIDDQKE